MQLYAKTQKLVICNCFSYPEYQFAAFKTFHVSYHQSLLDSIGTFLFRKINQAIKMIIKKMKNLVKIFLRKDILSLGWKQFCEFLMIED